jgi:hypothetical protein
MASRHVAVHAGLVIARPRRAAAAAPPHRREARAIVGT